MKTGKLNIQSKNVTFNDSAPSSPSTGDVWYETDTNIWWFWNGTYWLTVQTFSHADSFNGIVSNTIGMNLGLDNDPLRQHNLYFLGISGTTYVATTNNSTNFWYIRLQYYQNAGGSYILDFNTGATPDSADTYTYHKSAGAAVHITIPAVAPYIFRIETVKNNSPLAFYAGITTLWKWAHA